MPVLLFWTCCFILIDKTLLFLQPVSCLLQLCVEPGTLGDEHFQIAGVGILHGQAVVLVGSLGGFHLLGACLLAGAASPTVGQCVAHLAACHEQGLLEGNLRLLLLRLCHFQVGFQKPLGEQGLRQRAYGSEQYLVGIAFICFA